MSELKPKILQSPLSKCWYLATKYKGLKNGQFEATKKIDITEELERILSARKPDTVGLIDELIMLYNSVLAIGGTRSENKKIKDRIAELTRLKGGTNG